MPPPAEELIPRLILGPALRTQPDRRLVKLVRDGYETAFEEIVRRYGRQLGRYAAAIVGPRAEDITQDAFSKALLALRRSEAEIELRPWLYRIVRNTALNDLRDRPAAAAELAETIASGSNPAETIEQREELTNLMSRLQALPEAQRAAIVMRELEGLSHEEIAAALGMSGGAARQAIYRARRALRDGMGMLLPLPLLKALLGPEGSAAAEAATGAAGVAGVGIAVKATTATVLVAGTVGAGVALHERDTKDPDTTARAAALQPPPPSSGAASPLTTVSDESGESSSSGGNRGGGARDGHDDEHGDDKSGHGRGTGDDRQAQDDSGHPGSPHADPSGHGGSGSGHDGGGDPSDKSDDRSGPGDGSSASKSGPGGGSPSSSGGSDSGTSGSGGSEAAETSGSDGSGSGSSGSSGSGETEDDDGGSGSGGGD